MASKTKRPRTSKADKPAKKADKTKAEKKAFPLVSRADLNRLLEQCLVYQNRASTATGSMGELVRTYADRKHVHAPAFALIKRLHQLGNRDRGKLWLLLAHFDDMRQKSSLDRLAQEQGQLLPALSEEDEGENVTSFPQPREVGAEEQAGAA